MNYSRFGAICEVDSAKAERKRSESGAKAERKRSESASVRPYRNRDVAPLFAPKESRVPYISSQEKVLQMCYYT